MAYWLAWDLGVCSSQGLRIDSLWCQFWWAKSIRSYALALNGAPTSGRWDWSPRISRFLDRIPSFFYKKNKNLKICEDFGKIKKEDSKGLRRLYRGRNSVPRSRGKLFGRKHLKRQKNKEFGPGTHNHAPRAWPLGHSHALGHVLCAPCIQNSGRTSHYKYQSSSFRISP